jgi:hypothetical protein
MFGFFKRRDFYDTAKDICDVYKKSLALSGLPKEALVHAIGHAMQLDKNLKHIPPIAYCSSIFGQDFENMSDDSSGATEFVRKAIINVIAANLHPECNSMLYVSDFSNQNPSIQLRNVVHHFI